MKTDLNFSDISPSETRDLAFDFTRDLFPLTPETLASAVFTIEVDDTAPGSTIDTLPNTRKSGSADIDDNENGDVDVCAVQRVTGMVDGNKYRIICRATTSNTQILELYAHMWCRVAN